MVLKDDPTLMFINAGMNPFKDLFLGNSPIKYQELQIPKNACVLMESFNDLEEVGIDTYHHTMFEMLGNWSFGDYFKEAISWAWELLTEHYKLDKNDLYVTVFEGDKGDNLPLTKKPHTGKNIYLKTESSSLVRRTTSGKWGIRDHVGHVQRYTLITDQKKKRRLFQVLNL